MASFSRVNIRFPSIVRLRFFLTHGVYGIEANPVPCLSSVVRRPSSVVRRPWFCCFGIKILDFELRHSGKSHDMSKFSYVCKEVKQ